MLGFLRISPAFVLREVTHFCLLASPLSLAGKVTWDDNIEPEFEGLRMLLREGDTVGGSANLTLCPRFWFPEAVWTGSFYLGFDAQK